VEDRGWLSAEEFEHGIAATNLLPGPASTQLAILCAWRLRRTAGAVLGGLCFILPGLVVILALSVLFFSGHPARWVLGAAAGAGAVVAAVALKAAIGLMPASWRRAGTAQGPRIRWSLYLAVGAAAAATTGSFLVLVLIGCGLVEVGWRRWRLHDAPGLNMVALPAFGAVAAAGGGLAALAWVALKVGALSFGGGFVIVPLMQADAVHQYHWMTGAQFLNAVALGQVTPGPVTQTVAVVGYAAGGLAGGLLASAVAFAPSFLVVLVGAPHFDRLRSNPSVQHFLSGAGPAAIGAIAGAAVPLALALSHLWQLPVLAGAALWMLALRRGTVGTLVAAGALGVVLALCGLPVSV
jgi:chromate transporter